VHHRVSGITNANRPRIYLDRSQVEGVVCISNGAKAPCALRPLDRGYCASLDACNVDSIMYREAIPVGECKEEVISIR